jgi:EmrB/QacA subfamily drug resistance transporter
MDVVPATGHPRRWAILGILNLSLVLIVASVSSLNLAIPSIQRALHASASELVWINASYSLVFAGFLLPAGAFGDRFGRKGALQAGLSIFLVGALLATLADSPEQLIALRGLMGVGAALTMPATLSIITVVFPPQERAKAIAIWAGFAGAGGAIGVLASGVLLTAFSWHAVFLVNVPIAAAALLFGAFIVPTSKDSKARPLDPLGSILSFGGLVALVYGLVQGPEKGWTNAIVIAAFVASVLMLTAWVTVELVQRFPLLDPRLFLIPRFAVGTFTITSTFLVMFGQFFVLTQYLQFARGYTPLQAAVRTLPFAVAMILVAPRGPALVARFGRGAAMTAGMLIAAAGVATAGMLDVDSPYLLLVLALVAMACGMAIVFPASTESIVSSLPRDKAGVASAVNDTTREVGGAIGIALLGTLLSSGYRAALGDTGRSLAPPVRSAFRDNLGSALTIAGRSHELANQARDAFISGMQLALLVGAGILVVAALIVWRFHPRQPAGATDEHELADAPH